MTSPETNSAEALAQQASQWHRQGRLKDAAGLFEQLLQREPMRATAWHELAYVYKALGAYSEALHAFAQALEHGMARPWEIHLDRAILCADALRLDVQARDELHAALQCKADYLPALLNLGNWHEQHGDRTAALDCYQRVLQLPNPQPANLRWVALARSAIIEPPSQADDPRFSDLERALTQVGQDPQVRPHLLFALGHGLDAVGRYDDAFEAYAKGNRSLLRASGRRHDRRQVEALTDAFIGAFSEPASSRSADAGEGPAPLFICGMFRSGSTLLEQVLAAHPQICAGGELDWLLRTAAQRLAPFPQSMQRVSDSLLRQLAGEYRAHLRTLFPDAPADGYLTDKRPDNFQLIGFIKCLFPSARIIHTVRQPLDNALSVFMQNINLDVASYAHDLGDIGHYYGQYRRLMQHWQSLYPGSIHDFDYDAFVDDPEPQLRALLDALQLPWAPQCLQFHQLRNAVKTASYWQIRRPLYRGSSGRWRHYTDHLDPLRQSLREAGINTAD